MAARRHKDRVQELEVLVQKMRDYMENRPVPRQVVLARKGRVYHPTDACQGFQNANKTILEDFEFCSFCAIQEAVKTRHLFEHAVSSGNASPI